MDWVNMGGFLANPELSDKIRRVAQPMFKWRQFVRPIEGFGKGKGEKQQYDRFKNVTTEGGKISELAKMPETGITMDKGEVLVDEWGNAIPWTGKLETLSQWDPRNMYQQALKDDMAKVIEKEVAAVAKATQLRYTPTGTVAVPTSSITYAATHAVAATRNLLVWDLEEIREYLLDQAKIPPYDDEDFVMLTSIGGGRALRDDPDWEDTAKYADPERLLSGETGRIRNFRIVETNLGLISKMGAAATYRGEAIVFGDDPLVEAVAVAEELRAKVPDDYGRSRGIAWYALLGFGRVWDPTSLKEGEPRILYVGSA